MKLRELEAKFLVIETPVRFRMTEELKDAHGVTFLCPKCFAANNGPVGTHHVLCWFKGVDPERSPGPGRWNPQGTGLDDLTFVPPGAVSVQLMSGCMWHGHVSQGAAA